MSTPVHPKLVMPLQFVKGRALKYCIGLGKERVKSLRVIKKNVNNQSHLRLGELFATGVEHVEFPNVRVREEVFFVGLA